MKLLQEPIHVEKRGQLPHRVIWRLQPYQVRQVEERWLYHGKWWTTPQLRGHCRRYFRLLVCSAAGTELFMEVYEERAAWVLARVQD